MAMRIVVIGDSVLWGQGLLNSHKFAQIVANAFSPVAGGDTPVEMFAHSGAIIDPMGTLADQGSRCSLISGEIPQSAPSIRAQARSVPNPGSVDLLLMDGGINDVTVADIVNPILTMSDLNQAIQEACYTGMKTLLSEVLARFTSSTLRIVVTGYFPILSPQSDQSLFGDLLSIFGLQSQFIVGKDIIAERMTVRCMTFWQQSDAALSRAVNESLGSAGPGRKLIYVPGPLREQNSLFAPTPWLFGLNRGGPEDEVVAQRAASCGGCYNQPVDFLQRKQCGLASVGHPNAAGEAAFANAILAAL